eukprot:scaffold26998_cov28-Attheya_sp.AAC.1
MGVWSAAGVHTRMLFLPVLNHVGGFAFTVFTDLLEIAEDVDEGKDRGLGLESLSAHVAHDNGLGVLAVIVDVSPRGHALEQFETIVRGEEPHAAHAWVMDQFFALVGGAVDPLGDWVFFWIPGGWFLGTGDGARGDGLDLFDGLAIGTSFCAEAYPVFVGLRIDNNKMNRTIFVYNSNFCGTLVEILVAALVVWQYDRRHPRELRPINVQPEIMLIALSRRGGINQCKFLVVGLALPKSERKCDELCRTDICDRGD